MYNQINTEPDMRCDECELYYRCGGSDTCPFEYSEDALMDIDTLCEVTGVEEGLICHLIDENYFYDAVDDVNYYVDGYFKEYAITMVNNYISMEED
jgi:hypothetical protein